MHGHCGFTQEQLDFIVNYDIKHRMGRTRRYVEDSSTYKKHGCRISVTTSKPTWVLGFEGIVA